jgi:hypothetical protein
MAGQAVYDEIVDRVGEIPISEDHHAALIGLVAGEKMTCCVSRHAANSSEPYVVPRLADILVFSFELEVDEQLNKCLQRIFADVCVRLIVKYLGAPIAKPSGLGLDCPIILQGTPIPICCLHWERIILSGSGEESVKSRIIIKSIYATGKMHDVLTRSTVRLSEGWYAGGWLWRAETPQQKICAEQLASGSP